ncbi:EthD family reductase [Agromyces sp. Marseille-P2726]|uniref:EthD family reductase n=1 Tax=Agromyces sp. Marseille-P2726 TaxID=2709132 RepID=UPI0015704DB0|nr:EthD family reductase [Agromyces sp. Marseille-P2726]
MYCARVMYRTTDEPFDHEYYVSKHVPRFVELLGDRCLRLEVQTPTQTPESAPAEYAAVAYVWLDSPDAIGQTLAEHGDEILGDIPNFTQSTPEVDYWNVTAAR